MTTVDFITDLFCRVDDEMKETKKHSQSSLYPSEIVVLGLLHALKGVGNRAFYRWLIRDYHSLFPVQALQMAFWRRKPAPGLLHHSDRGCQYASKEYREHLAIMRMEQSMSRKGNCWDNSPTERFFRSLKYEQLNYEKFSTQEAAKLSVIDYLAFYNGKRIHSTLGYKSPLDFERDFFKNAAS